jgi:hypothetical protein
VPIHRDGYAAGLRVIAQARKFLIGQPAIGYDGDGANGRISRDNAARACDQLLEVMMRALVRHWRRTQPAFDRQNRMKPRQARGERVAYATMARSRGETRCPTRQIVATAAPTAMTPTTGRMSMRGLPRPDANA